MLNKHAQQPSIKKGDLALIIKAKEPSNLGKSVRVVGVLDCGEDGIKYIIDGNLSGDKGRGKYCDDSCLMPLEGMFHAKASHLISRSTSKVARGKK